MQIYLNVGGALYTTTRETLMSNAHTFFRGMLEHNQDRFEFFIDRDPTHFRHILNWLRGVRWIPEDLDTLSELEWEADFFSIVELVDAIRLKRRAARARARCGGEAAV